MFQKPIYVTQHGLDQLEEELNYLKKVKRPQLIEDMHDAMGTGDWVDNNEYMLLEDEIAFVDGRIQNLQYMINNAELIPPGKEDNIVELGERVVIQSEDMEVESYTIVGVAETDPGHGLISNESPLGRALLNRKVGDDIVVHTPSGVCRYRILAVTTRQEEPVP